MNKDAPFSPCGNLVTADLLKQPDSQSAKPILFGALDRNAWALRIGEEYERSRESIFNSGLLLIEAKRQLGRTDFNAMVADDLPFAAKTAIKLMRIAADRRLAPGDHDLPIAQETLYQISTLDDGQLERAKDAGLIRPDAKRNEITAFKKKESRGNRLAALADRTEAESRNLGSKLYPVIYADPAWRYEPRSRETGMDRAADNHYPTMTKEEIAAIKIPATVNAALFLWATAPMIEHAFWVMNFWGFEYSSQIVWIKDRISTGYWTRGKHEILLIGTRGSIPAPTPGTQPDSAIEAPSGPHSEKPDIFWQIIEGFYPDLPKLEMFAREPDFMEPRDATWDFWGNEAPEQHSDDGGQLPDASGGQLPDSAPPPGPAVFADEIPEFLDRRGKGAV